MMLSQPNHLVQLSPWPLTSSLGAMWLTLSLSVWFHLNMMPSMLLALMVINFTMIYWWRDVVRKAGFLGEHPSKVQRGLEWGMMLFISSEVMFFSAFFWAFFHSSLAPTMELGCNWPPSGAWLINPFSIPLLNIAVLLASGVTVTYAHHSILKHPVLKMPILIMLMSMSSSNSSKTNLSIWSLILTTIILPIVSKRDNKFMWATLGPFLWYMLQVPVAAKGVEVWDVGMLFQPSTPEAMETAPSPSSKSPHLSELLSTSTEGSASGGQSKSHSLATSMPQKHLYSGEKKAPFAMHKMMIQLQEQKTASQSKK